MAKIENCSISTKGRPQIKEAFLALGVALFAGSALASPLAIEQINTAVENHLYSLNSGSTALDQRLEVKVGYIDPRLNLPLCSHEPRVELNGNSRPVGKLQVKVSCSGDRPWSKFIPAEVNLFSEVAVATGSVRRGVVIESHHIQMMEINVANLRRAPVFNPASLLGMELKYPLTAGSAYSLDIVKSPVVIQRGDLVQMVAQSGNLEIKQQGEAMQNGAIGHVISVKNSSSKVVIQAEVVSSGRVKIQL